MSDIPDDILLRSTVASWDDEKLYRLAHYAGLQAPPLATRGQLLDLLTDDADVCRNIIEYLERPRPDEPPPEGALTRAEMIGLRVVQDEDDG